MLLQTLVFIGVSVVVYAIYGLFSSRDSETRFRTKKFPARIPRESGPDPKDQKIQRLEEQLNSLEEELQKAKQDYLNILKSFEAAKIKEPRLQEELNRRQDWVVKSEEMLDKVKAENAELRSKFLEQEKKLEEEFTKNVNLTKELNQLKEGLEGHKEEKKEISEQSEIQKHQLEKYAEEIKAHLTTINELKKKEENSEWVPKQEFNRLNEEYAKLEKELEEKEKKLEIYVEELALLKNQLNKKTQPPPVQESPQQPPEEIKEKEPAKEEPAKPEETPPKDTPQLPEKPS